MQLLIFAGILLAVSQQAFSLECYSCRQEYAIRCELPEQMVAVKCAPSQDTCWKFAGNTTSAIGQKFAGQITRMCASSGDFRQWSPGSVISAGACTTVNNIRATDGQIYNGTVCLCNNKDLCNKSTRNQVSFGLVAAVLVLLVGYGKF